MRPCLVGLMAGLSCAPPVLVDTDGDGLTDSQEARWGLDPADADMDDDGLADGDEVLFHLTDPVDVDTDDDGLADGPEVLNHGTDPRVVDTDDDGLTDGAEIGVGADPNDPDSDDDGDCDGVEVGGGSDPLDATSRRYVGAWPTACHKSRIAASDDAVFVRGMRIPRWVFRDQHGDAFDLFDLYDDRDTTPVIVSMVAGWCDLCADLDDWRNFDEEGIFSGFEAVRQAVADARIRWVTIVSQGRAGADANWDDGLSWNTLHGNAAVPVLTDSNQRLVAYTEAPAWPAVLYLDADARVVSETTSPFATLSVVRADLEDGTFDGRDGGTP